MPTLSRRAFLLVTAGALGGAACSTSEPARGASAGTGVGASSPPPPTDPTLTETRIAYGTDPRQYGDLFLTDAATPRSAVPLVVMIHGGGWLARSVEQWTHGIARDLASTGTPVWNIEYRGSRGTGGWPATYLDVAAAIDFVPRLGEHAPVAVDTDRVVVCGHSAGGNLAAWVASRPALPAHAPGHGPAVRPRACVAMAGVYDLRLAFSQHDRFVTDLLGGPPRTFPGRYRDASPEDNLPTGIPVAVLHGRDDAVVDVDQAVVYADRARAAGDPVDIRLLDSAPHASWAQPGTPQWELAKAAVLSHV